MDTSRTPRENVCRYCGKSYSRTSSLTRHKKQCAEAQLYEMKHEKELYIKEKEMMDKELQHERELCIKMEADAEYGIL